VKISILAIAGGLAFVGPNISQAQGVEQTSSNTISFSKIDGPYTYKSPKDLIAIVGFVTETNGVDDALFRDCDGNIRSVKRHDLKRTQRNCPPGSGTTPWIVNRAGSLVPVGGSDSRVKAYFASGKAEIGPAAVPAEYRDDLRAAKPGAPAAISSPAGKGKLNVWIISKPEQQ
jgi:hypothetical protein